MKPAIRVENLSKSYLLGSRASGGYRTLRETITDSVAGAWDNLRRRLGGKGNGTANIAGKNDPFWALKDVSFEVEPGEVVGIVGRNGAGKSTLLKILSRITEPTSGRCEVRGRMGSLLEVGTGFHPELTGRENIYLNGSFLGMSRKEISSKLDEIVDFSELERFLETPVKRYSSGMYVRLAFAVAAHLNPEILVVDEVLAVGDANFQRKCLGKIQNVAQGGRTVLFVSHNMAAIQNLCSRCLVLEKGEIQLIADTEKAITYYNTRNREEASSSLDLRNHPGRTPGSKPSMTSVSVKSQSEDVEGFMYTKDDIEVSIEFELDKAINNVTIGFVVKNQFQVPVFSVNNLFLPFPQLDRFIQNGRILCQMESVPLLPGTYSLDLYLGSHGTNFDIIYDAIYIEILPRDVFGTGKLPSTRFGSILWPATWRIII